MCTLKKKKERDYIELFHDHMEHSHDSFTHNSQTYRQTECPSRTQKLERKKTTNKTDIIHNNSTPTKRSSLINFQIRFYDCKRARELKQRKGAGHHRNGVTSQSPPGEEGR